MIFHVCALPRTHTTTEYVSCAHTAKIINFCRMMKDRGLPVLLVENSQQQRQTGATAGADVGGAGRSGGLYGGGGGGGAADTSGNGGNGSQGAVIITYTTTYVNVGDFFLIF